MAAIQIDRYHNCFHVSWPDTGAPQGVFSVRTRTYDTDTPVTLSGARVVISGTQPNGADAGALVIEFDTSEKQAELYYTRTAGTGTASVSHAAKD